MTRSPVISFGLEARAVANEARLGRLTLRGRVAFLAAALEWAGDEDLRAAVLTFNRTVDFAPAEAGVALDLALDRWLDRVAPAIEQPRSEFQWQTRRGLQ